MSRNWDGWKVGSLGGSIVCKDGGQGLMRVLCDGRE
jgi:hypothetical protein